MTHNRRLDLALRRNRGRRILDSWCSAFLQACGWNLSADSFFSLEETEQLKDAFFAKVKEPVNSSEKTYWSKACRSNVEDYLRDVASRVRGMPGGLFSNVDEFIGAVRIPPDIVLEHAFSIWGVVGGDLCVASEDLLHGLCLEDSLYNSAGEYVKEGIYEILAWGKFANTG